MTQPQLPLFQDERDTVRAMELRTYDCGLQCNPFHRPHPHPRGGTCPGLTSRPCDSERRHDHHRWWELEVAFYWCNGIHRAPRGIEDVDLEEAYS